MSKVATRYDVTDCTTPEQLLAKCGLNWEPEVRGASYCGSDGAGDGAHYADPVGDCANFRAIVNPSTGRALTYASTRFKPNSHVKAVNDVWGLVRHGSATPHGVSVWDGGGRIALQFRCNELDVQVGPKSVISPLLTLVLNHSKAGADRGFFADFDYWCKNQAGQVARIQGDGVRHSANVISRYEDLLEERIRSLRTGMGDRYATMKRMASAPLQLNGKALVSYFARALDLAPQSVDETFKAAKEGEVLSADGKVLKALVADWRADDHGVPGSVWHAYSAVTRYTTHTEGRNEATRMQRALIGSQDRYVRAFSEAARLVSA